MRRTFATSIGVAGRSPHLVAAAASRRGMAALDSQLEHERELHRELANLCVPADVAARDRIRARVNAYVDEAKDRGWPPEQVVISVKAMTHDVGLRPSIHVPLSTPSHGLSEREALSVEIVGWCIERYFAAAAK